MVEIANIYASLVNQYKFNYQLSFLALFNEYGEEREITSQKDLRIILSITEKLTQSDLKNIDNQWT